jgi:hypothetical protein
MKRFGILLVMLALASLACKALLGDRGQSPDESPAGQAPAQPPLIQLPNLTGVQLGDEFRDEGCGYSFRKVPIYGFDSTSGFGPEMAAPGADKEAGPQILIFCGVHPDPRTNDDLIKQLTESTSGTPEANPITYSNPTNVMMGGVNAVSLDIDGTTAAGIVVKGRVAAAMVTPYRGLAIIGMAPSDKWDETRSYFDAVMNSVTFFEPTTTPTANP